MLTPQSIASFKPIHQFVAAAKDQKPAMTQYLEVLGRVYKELYAYVEAGEPPTQIGTIKAAVSEALGQTALLIQNFTPEANALVKPVLEQPIKMALTLTPAEDTSGASAPTLAPLTPPSLTGGGGAGSGLVIYKDDILGLAASPRALLDLLASTLDIIRKYGIQISAKKSVLFTTTCPPLAAGNCQPLSF